MSSLQAEGARLAHFVIMMEVNMNKLIPFGFPYKSPAYMCALPLPYLPALYKRSFLHVPRYRGMLQAARNKSITRLSCIHRTTHPAILPKAFLD